jgi:CheY-like chemotaxis protein
MAKIMLVEDDNNLRQIYEDRLAAEGYQIVSAKDGEEALALAVKERPDLIIADIMMPKVSGFDMLDILRSTPETKDAKIIMMTALSQAEDKTRAEQLGADRYLVKSQVTLEDVATVAAEMLNEQKATADTAVSHMTGDSALGNKTEPTAAPAVSTTPAPAAATPSVPPVSIPVSAPPTPAPVESPSVTSSPPSAPAPASSPISITVKSDDDDEDKSNDTTVTTDEPAAKEAENLGTPIKEEKADTEEKIDEFIASNPTLSASPGGPEVPKTEEPKSEEANNAPSLSNDQSTKVANAVDGLLKETERNDTSSEVKSGNSSNYVSDSPTTNNASQSMAHTKVIEPITNDITTKAPNLNDLLAKEAANETAAPPAANSVISPTNGVTGPTPSMGSMNDVAPGPIAGPPAPGSISL